MLRPALTGRAKTIVDLELEKRGIDPIKMAAFTEENYQHLYEYIVAYLEKRAGLTPEKKTEIALEKMATVRMMSPRTRRSG